MDPARDFSAEVIAREDAFHAAVRPWSYATLFLGLAVVCLLGLTPLGARLAELAARPFGGHWAAQAALGAVLVVAISRLATVPLAMKVELVLREYGLSVRSWPLWFSDRAKSLALAAVIAAVAITVLVGLVRALPTTWWLAAAGAAAGLVVVGSLLWPVLVEPLFLKATPMAEGTLRTEILAMAQRDGVPAQDVLVAEASRRTTAHNAYVSGFGPTRRIVLYDTLVENAPREDVLLITAHELGHAARRDVARGTAVGALGAALAVGLLALAVRPEGWLAARAGVSGLADGRVAALILALAAIAGLLVSPVENLISRRVEATADVHALDLTRDPQGYVSMQQRLAVQNLSDLDPHALAYVWFASHPTAPERIAMARDWARLNGVPTP